MYFIEEIAPIIKKYATEYGIKVCSPIIAQAILESSHGKSYKAQFHNYFGLKYRLNRVKCNKGYFKDGGSEQDKNGKYSLLPSTTSWYAFENMEQGVIGYFQFINTKNYSNLKCISEPRTYLELIKSDGYATSVNYVENLMNVIKTYDLTKYDNSLEKQTSDVIYKVQVGAYKNESNAKEMLLKLKSKGFSGFITKS